MPTARTPRPTRAVVVGVLAWALGVGAVALVLATRDPFPADPGYYTSADYFALHVIIAVTSGTAASVVLARSSHPVGAVAAVIALAFGSSAFSLGWAFLAAERGWPGVGLAGHGFAAFSQPGAFVALAVLPWFVRRDPAMGWPTRLAVGVGVTATAVLTSVALLHQQDGAPTNPLATLPGAAVVAQAPVRVLMVVCLLVGLLGVLDLVRRWRSGTEGTGRAMAVLVLGSALLLATVVQVQYGPDGTWLDHSEVVLLFLAQTLVALSVVVLTLGTWDLDSGRAVPRAATLALLVGVVALLHLALVTAGQALLPLDETAAGLLSVTFLALVLVPLRQALQVRVDRLVLGAAAEPGRVVTSVARQLRDHDPDELLPQLATNICRNLRLGAVTVQTPPLGTTTAGSPPSDATTTHTWPLVVGTRTVGTLSAAPRPGRRLEPATLAAIDQATGLFAAAADLASSNSRLVQVRDEERRMLRRELHDGLGPALAGIGLGLAAAQRRVSHDPAGTSALLEQLRDEVGRRVDDVRLLARAVLPVQLDEGDLGAALEVLAERFRGAGTDVVLEHDPAATQQLSPAAQVAAYHVIAEALLNAHRHGRAEQAQVVVALDPAGTTTVTVRDDGVGIDEAAPRGVGLTSMQERAAALSGTVVVQRRADRRGTEVRMQLP